jgi:Fuc2NAc and GlcNAc transferase
MPFGVPTFGSVALFTAVAAGCGWLLTALVRRYALRRQVLDVPNVRSLHERPIPRGGGLSVVLVALSGVGLAALGGLLSRDTAIALAGGGAAVALIGWIDDHRHTSYLVRLAVQFAAAGWALYWLGGYTRLELGAGSLYLGGLGSVLALVGIVWSSNLYNFMDGIDGLATMEAVFVGAVGGLFLFSGGKFGLAIVSLLISAASLGFLYWNWAPARIFMGDVGSGFLGYIFVVLALSSDKAGGPSLLIWMLLLGVFATDATVTLLRRVARGEPWSHAHCSHAYQRLIHAGWGHGKVSLAAAGTNLLLAAAAAVALMQPRLLGAMAATGFAFLLLLYVMIERLAPMVPTPTVPTADDEEHVGGDPTTYEAGFPRPFASPDADGGARALG